MRSTAVYGRTAASGEAQDIAFKNPFAFWPVVGFALFLALVIVAGRALGEAFGAAGAIVGALIAGLADVDAISISMARLVPAPLGWPDATLAILAAVASNTFAKVAIGAAIGRGRFSVEIALMALGCLVAGAAATWATFALLKP